MHWEILRNLRKIWLSEKLINERKWAIRGRSVDENKKNCNYSFNSIMDDYGFIAIKSTKKLTYLEYQYENEIVDDCIELKSNGEYLEQRFTSPYDILHGVAVKIGTFSRDNNSVWNISLLDG